jgi:hypothetical protein
MKDDNQEIVSEAGREIGQSGKIEAKSREGFKGPEVKSVQFRTNVK